VGSNPIESDLVELSDVSPLKKVIIYCRGVKVVSYSVKENELGSEPSVLNLFQESVVKPRDVGT